MIESLLQLTWMPAPTGIEGGVMDYIDIAVVKFLNSFAWKATFFDRFVIDILQMNSVKAMPIVCVAIWIWFSKNAGDRERKAIFNAFLGALAAVLLTRNIQNFLPFKPRPSLEPTLDFVLPAGAYHNYGSTFPSDTAGLAFALVLGIWLASRRGGYFTLFWTLAVVCFPRLYGGFHYLSDIVVGGLMGFACTYLFVRVPRLSDPLYSATMKLAADHRPWFYVLGFIVAYQTTHYYLDPRKIVEQGLFTLGFKQQKLQHLQKQKAEKRPVQAACPK
jgi:membrane-associated phospholipid phosphatase